MLEIMSGAYSTTNTAGPWVDIDLGSLCANYAFIRDQAKGAQTAAVVKCNAYGLGLEAVAKALTFRENCKQFFVAYPEEGAALRGYLGEGEPEIYVFNGPMPETIPLFEQARLTPVLNSLEQARSWAQHMPNSVAALHVDTGMNRLGAPGHELDAIASLESINICLVMSHLACASQPSHPMNKRQRDCFLQAASKFHDVTLSLSASGGALMDKDYHFDLLRPGIALYGGSPFNEDEPRLRPVVALRAPIIQLIDAGPGDTVGYDATHEINKKTRLATVALGYGDGFPRTAADQAEVFIADTRLPVVGRISMDLISIDVTATKKPIKTGDVVTVYGEGISLFETAKACRTIPYELLTGLGGRVDRRYF